MNIFKMLQSNSNMEWMCRYLWIRCSYFACLRSIVCHEMLLISTSELLIV